MTKFTQLTNIQNTELIKASRKLEIRKENREKNREREVKEDLIMMVP